MRPIWKGFISFGLVNIPVRLYSAERRVDLRFHMIDSRNQARVRYQRVNEETGEEVPWDKVVHAYEYDDHNYVTLKDQDFKKAASIIKMVKIENFVAQDDIGYEYFERPYFLMPEQEGLRSYALLREALKKKHKIAVAKVVIHGREHLAAIMAADDMLILDLLRFKQELRDQHEFEIADDPIHFSAAELRMAETLIDSMTSAWQPELYHDEYREALMHWIDEKAKGRRALPAPPVPMIEVQKEPRDLVELMRKSIESMRRVRHAKNVKEQHPRKRRLKAG